MNTSTATIEDQLRNTLQRRAAITAPRPDEAGVRRHVQRRRRRRRVVPALGAIAALTAGLAVSTRVRDDEGRATTAAEDTGVVLPAPDLAAAGGAPMLVLPGWSTVRYAEIHYGDGAQLVVEPEYQFAANGRNLQLHLYPGGRATRSSRHRRKSRKPAG